MFDINYLDQVHRRVFGLLAHAYDSIGVQDMAAMLGVTAEQAAAGTFSVTHDLILNNCLALCIYKVISECFSCILICVSRQFQAWKFVFS